MLKRRRDRAGEEDLAKVDPLLLALTMARNMDLVIELAHRGYDELNLADDLNILLYVPWHLVLKGPSRVKYRRLLNRVKSTDELPDWSEADPPTARELAEATPKGLELAKIRFRWAKKMMEMEWPNLSEEHRRELCRDKDQRDSWYSSSPLSSILAGGPDKLARDICKRAAEIPGPPPGKGSLLEWAAKHLPRTLPEELRTSGFSPKDLLPHTPRVHLDPLIKIPDITEFPRYMQAAEEHQLPLFPSSLKRIPEPPLIHLAHKLGVGQHTRGNGARADKRILLFSILQTPANQRRPGGRFEWEPTVDQLRALLWNTWRPSERGKSLINALAAVSVSLVRLPDGEMWAPVVVRKIPNPYNLESRALLEIKFPDNIRADRGPAVPLPALVEQGKISDPAFDLWLALCYMWDAAKLKNEYRPIYAGDPAAELLPVLALEDCRCLAYGHQVVKHRGQRSRQRHKAAKLIEDLEAAGYVVIHRHALDRDSGLVGWRVVQAPLALPE